MCYLFVWSRNQWHQIRYSFSVIDLFVKHVYFNFEEILLSSNKHASSTNINLTNTSLSICIKHVQMYSEWEKYFCWKNIQQSFSHKTFLMKTRVPTFPHKPGDSQWRNWSKKEFEVDTPSTCTAETYSNTIKALG